MTQTSTKRLVLTAGADGYGQGVVTSPTVRRYTTDLWVTGQHNGLDAQLLIAANGTDVGINGSSVVVNFGLLGSEFSFPLKDLPRTLAEPWANFTVNSLILAFDPSSTQCCRSAPSLRNMWWRKYMLRVAIATTGQPLTGPLAVYMDLEISIVNSAQANVAGFGTTLFVPPGP